MFRVPGLVDEIDAMTSSVSARRFSLRAGALAVAALTGTLVIGIATPAFAALAATGVNLVIPLLLALALLLLGAALLVFRTWRARRA